MVYFYAANISSLADPLEYPEILEGLSQERKTKILNCKKKQNRMQSLGAGLLLNKVLSLYGISMENIYTDSNGKPIVDGICFNLSHSGDIVICAVSKTPVGCDIEQIKEAPRKVAERKFSDEEIAHLQQFAGDAYNREFFRIWTKKESYLKMKGTGLRVSLNELEISDCYMQEYEYPGYQICVCAKENEFADLIWENI